MLPFERTSTRRTANPEKGQSLLEMCFGFITLLMIVSGVVDLGRLYFAYVSLEDAAGEAALYLSINPRCPWDLPATTPTEDNGSPITGSAIVKDCDPPNNGMYRARYAGGQTAGVSLVDWRTISYAVTCSDYDVNTNTYSVMANCSNANTGDLVEVRLQYDFPLLSPYIPQIAGSNTITLTSMAQQLVIVDQ
jgi:hypothetical protein